MTEKPQSRFWAGSDNSETESDSDVSDEVDEVQQKAEERDKWESESESSEDEAQRIVKSARGKAEEAFQKAYKELKNSVNINDWNTISTTFQKLASLLTKHADVIQGKRSGAIDNYPDYYFLSLKTIQQAIQQMSQDRSAQKKLSKTNGKSFNAMRARVKKLVTEDYQERIDAVEEKVESESESELESSDSDSDSGSDSSSGSGSGSDSVSEPAAGTVEADDSKPKSKFFDVSDSDWGSDSEESSSESETEGPLLTGRARWVKQAAIKSTVVKTGEKKQKERGKQERAQQRKIQKQLDQEKREKEHKKEEEEFTEENALEKVAEIIASRGKKNISKMELIKSMRILCDRSIIFGSRFRLPLLMHLITLQFDLRSGLDEYMPVDIWLSALNDLKIVMDSIEEEEYVLVQFVGTLNADGEEEEYQAKDSKEVRVVGDLSVFLDRLHGEYEKSLRHMNNHSQEYVNRLKDEASISELARRVFNYYVRMEDPLKAALQAIITLQTNYYKHASVAVPVYHAHLLMKRFGDRQFWHPGAISSESDTVEGLTSEKQHPAAALGSISSLIQKEGENCDFDLEEEIQTDCSYIFKHGTNEMKCIATLCQIYHYALHDNFYKARDLLLMSRLQDTIYTFEIDAQILFNRTIAQLGFCAFRAGQIQQCHRCLMDLCQQGSKTKELIAQGVFWRRQRTGMDAKALEAFQRKERRRLLPFHMHINLDLLEFFHLTSAMLLEIPNIAASDAANVRTGASYNHNYKVLSRTFRRHLDQYDRQVFTGPPENTRDHVLAASRHMRNGDWKGCSDLLLNLPVWKLFTSRSEETRTMLVKEIKTQSLRTYLINYAAIYDAIGADYLCGLFELSESEIHKIVSKMLVEDEIKGCWDYRREDQDSESKSPTLYLSLRTNEPTHLQALARKYAEKLGKFVESNEKKINKSNGFDGFGNNQGGNEDSKRGFKFRKGYGPKSLSHNRRRGGKS